MTTPYKYLIFIFSLLILSPLSWGEEFIPTVLIEEESSIETSNISPYATNKVENVSAQKFKQPQRHSLADMVKDQVGVEAQTYCSNCGAKRLTINGLKAEYTSILVDGLPLHSAVSSFYGVDNIPVNGIQDIEVMRGAGASLTNPEAIGGTINIITLDPLEKVHTYRTSLSLNDEGNGSAQNHSVIFSNPNKDKKKGYILGAQFTETEAWDEDDNGVAEAPNRNNKSVMAKARFLPDSKSDIKFRAGYSELTVLGGAVNAKKPSKVRETPAQEEDFEDGNVEKKFIGDKEQITDWINLKRYESSFHLKKYQDNDTTFEWNTGFARQEQRAIYQHGFDYANNDNILVSDLSQQTVVNGKHIAKGGLFFRYQRLRSSSEELFEKDDLAKDHFDNTSIAAYGSFTYIQSEQLEMDFALRFDGININWLDLDNKINETVIAPRYQLRHEINEHLSQRFSYGLGYRVPLTFFESQHGNEENGYEVDITKLEKAHSLVYTLSYNTPKYYATLGLHYTHLDNMAFGFESQGNPIYYRNAKDDYDIMASDILLGYKIRPWWLLEASVEAFNYQDGYTAKLPTAAIEERLQLKSTYEKDNWTNYTQISIVGARNLSRYGRYSDHYVDRNQFPSPEQRGDERKDQNAPTFFLIDTAFTYQYSAKYEFGFGINNLLDETQVKYGDSPSAWHWHFDHAHYDGLHTWGPNRGREFYLQLKISL